MFGTSAKEVGEHCGRCSSEGVGMMRLHEKEEAQRGRSVRSRLHQLHAMYGRNTEILLMTSAGSLSSATHVPNRLLVLQHLPCVTGKRIVADFRCAKNVSRGTLELLHTTHFTRYALSHMYSIHKLGYGNGIGNT